ncbi:sex muscle abnormal protein 5 isoform X2 [Aplysia californica]|uniref:Sex muscle abnormal protein 5 isoform X2 n=1 Tax=Aplysia californica TaxID=6500 RepID=A0ABM1VRW4_APLCA|nr:sex muscle abnormal protein 5 isoform X2 [Aplysia californica]
MEAVALWDFTANQPDEMSFRRGDRLCVVNMEEDGWYKAVLGPNSGFIPAAYIKMEPNEWFQNPMTRADAEAMLLKKNCVGSFIHEDGNFVVRKAETDSNGFSLSVKHEESVQHFKILRDANNKFYIWTTSSFSINQLVERYRTENVSGDPRRIMHLKDMKREFFKAIYGNIW